MNTGLRNVIIACGIAIYFLLLLFRGIFVGNARAVHVLEKQGYRHVTVTSRHVFPFFSKNCSSRAAIRLRSLARDANGQMNQYDVCLEWPSSRASIHEVQ